MKDYYNEIRSTVEDPLVIWQNNTDKHSTGNLYFSKGLGRGAFQPLYLAVAVDFQDAYNGIVKTAHFQSDLSRTQEGGLLYVRPKR